MRRSQRLIHKRLMSSQILHQPKQHRFAWLSKEGDAAVLEYDEFTAKGQKIYDFFHTGTPPSLRGQGIAGKLVKEAFQHCETNKIKIIPTCSYVKKWADKAEWTHLVYNSDSNTNNL